MLGFSEHEAKTKGWVYLVVLVAGEGPEEDLGVGQQRPGPEEDLTEHLVAVAERAQAGVNKRNQEEKSTAADRRPCRAIRA